MKHIPFSPPDITEEEIAAVADALRSGWITTGPRTAAFEREIAAYCGADRAVCLNSATAALELALRALGIGPGDEVITTWSASLRDGVDVRLASETEASSGQAPAGDGSSSAPAQNSGAASSSETAGTEAEG